MVSMAKDSKMHKLSSKFTSMHVRANNHIMAPGLIVTGTRVLPNGKLEQTYSISKRVGKTENNEQSGIGAY
jgi:hypothetical protein